MRLEVLILLGLNKEGVEGIMDCLEDMRSARRFVLSELTIEKLIVLLELFSDVLALFENKTVLGEKDT